MTTAGPPPPDPGPAATGAWPRRAVRAATLVFLGVLLAWSVTTPALRAPDEPAHVSGVIQIARTGNWPAPAESVLDPGVRAAQHAVGFDGQLWWAENPRLGPPEPDQGPTAASLERLREVGARLTPVPDPATAQPPGYYVLLAPVFRVLTLDDDAPVAVVLALRLASLLLLAPVPWLAARAAYLLGMDPRSVAAAAFVPTGWIQFVHIGASLNTGAIVVVTASAATVLLIPVLTRQDTGPVRAAAVGLLVSIGLLAKAFALGVAACAVVAYGLLVVGRRTRAAWSAAGIMVLTAVPGLLWWMTPRAYAATGSPAATGGPAGGSPERAWAYARIGAQQVSESMWANLGWLNTPLPAAVHVPVSVAALALLLVGAPRLHRPRTTLVLHGAWIVPLALIVVWSWRVFVATDVSDGMQGRYLQSGVVVLAAAAVAGLGALSTRLVGLVPIGALVAAVAGLVLGLRSFWRGADPRIALGWWPGGWLVGASALALVLAGVALLAADRRGGLRS